jgi:Cu(I)/Ag(I) efflux system protein CusF
MKTQTYLLVAVLLAAASQQPSNAGTPSPASDGGMQMKTDASVTKASATGIVKVVDATAGKITISHGPVAALNWPAMTMAFKATPQQLASVHVGQKVDFEFLSKGMDGTLTRIWPGK